MRTVTIVMSAYNGSNRIVQQLDSLFTQKNVDVTVYVRDDGSTDDTLRILKQYRDEKQPTMLLIEEGENYGWKLSFLIALQNAPSAQYYAFSDQDDIWFDNKLSRCIAELEKYDVSKAQMIHCDRISCNEQLVPLKCQAPKVPCPLSRENAVIQEYAQGCTIVMNSMAKELVCSHIPKTGMSHDFWTGMVCYFFGEVHYCPEPLFYHINHGNNASTAGHILASQIARVRNFFSQPLYPNPANDLLEGYAELLGEDKFIMELKNYRHCLKARSALLFNPKFRRVNIAGTVMLKIAVLLGKIK
jgi:rhamnosyltransferase